MDWESSGCGWVAKEGGVSLEEVMEYVMRISCGNLIF